MLVGKVAAAAPTTVPDGNKNDMKDNTDKAVQDDNSTLQEPVPRVGKKGKNRPKAYEGERDDPPSVKKARGNTTDPKIKAIAKNLQDFKKEFQSLIGQAHNMIGIIQSDQSWAWEKSHDLGGPLKEALQLSDAANADQFIGSLMTLESKAFFDASSDKDFKVTVPATCIYFERGGFLIFKALISNIMICVCLFVWLLSVHYC